jgi:hypothetical protein
MLLVVPILDFVRPACDGGDETVLHDPPGRDGCVILTDGLVGRWRDAVRPLATVLRIRLPASRHAG